MPEIGTDHVYLKTESVAVCCHTKYINQKIVLLKDHKGTCIPLNIVNFAYYEKSS